MSLTQPPNCPAKRDHLTPPKVRTQSGPPDDCGRQHDGGMKVSGQLVIAGCDAPPVLEASKHALDKVAAFIGIAIERLEVLAGRVVWNDRRGSAFDQKVSKPVCVIGGVRRAGSRRRQRLQQRLGGPDIALLAGGYLKRDRPPAPIADRMDLGGSAPTGATDRLGLRPPFPPAAARCALAVVESMA